MSDETGALPTGFAGFTSSSGAFLSVAGEDFGSGPNKVSGGLTRRGRDCAATVTAMATTAQRLNKMSGDFRFFINAIVSDSGPYFQWQTRREPETVHRMRKAGNRFAYRPIEKPSNFAPEGCVTLLL